MKRISKLAIALGTALVCVLANASIPNRDNPTPFLGPTLHASHTSYLNDNYAYSFAGDLGFRTVRGSATFGWAIADNQRVKGTVEILSQKLDFSYYSGVVEDWVNQGAIGLDYVYDYNLFNNSQFDINGYYSYAGSENLSTRYGFSRTLPNQIFYNYRRIAGGRGYGVSPGVMFNPWIGSKAWLALNYDNIRYDTHYDSANHDVSGFGGSVSLNQLITDNVSVDLIAGIRQIFNTYQANLNWSNLSYFGRWNLGIYGGYLHGNHGLVSSWDMGVKADYFFDPEITLATSSGRVKARAANPLVSWTGNPAIRMPQVLAVADQRLVTFSTLPPICPFGTVSGPTILPNNAGFYNTNIDTNISGLYEGENKQYAVISITTDDPDFFPTASISPEGILTVFGPDPGEFVFFSATVTVSITNPCGPVIIATQEVDFLPTI